MVFNFTSDSVRAHLGPCAFSAGVSTPDEEQRVPSSDLRRASEAHLALSPDDKVGILHYFWRWRFEFGKSCFLNRDEPKSLA